MRGAFSIICTMLDLLRQGRWPLPNCDLIGWRRALYSPRALLAGREVLPLPAVLEKRAGLNLIGDDVFVNIAGGMTVDEPASDLGVLAAIASSVRNRVIPATTAMFGEVGLAGEVRGISQAPLRIREAAQMGFQRCVLPEANIDPSDRGQLGGECELVGVRTVGEALDVLLS